jgi:NDP-sugar pyrophosphorylase family protein
MLLCAGLGTRLGPLSSERPKPMLPVVDLPILRYGIANLVGHGITELVINTHHRGDVIEREIGDGAAFGARIRYSHEPELLGTGGGLKHAVPLLDPEGRDEPFVSLNGKLIFDVDLTALLAAYRADPGILGMMVVRRVPDAVAWGAVDVRPDAAGHLRVHDVLGQGQHMFCGVHVTRPSVVSRLPAGDACMIRQGYLPWLRAGAPVAAFEHTTGYFAEHSTLDRYLASNLALLSGVRLTYPPGPAPGHSRPYPGRFSGVFKTAKVDPSAELIEPVYVGPGAVIGAGAIVGPEVVIGEGAEVAAGARIRRSVVWGGARVEGEVNGSIVTVHGTVPSLDR